MPRLLPYKHTLIAVRGEIRGTCCLRLSPILLAALFLSLQYGCWPLEEPDLRIDETLVDNDGDGVTVDDDPEDDCDDADAARYPGAEEICDGIDNDCDFVIPEDEADEDGDEYRACVDCDDGNPDIHPGVTDTCNDEVDNDCDGESGEDTTSQRDDEPNGSIEEASDLGVLNESEGEQPCTTVEGQLLGPADEDYYSFESKDEIFDDWSISASLTVPAGTTYCVELLGGDPPEIVDSDTASACAAGASIAEALVDFVLYNATGTFWVRVWSSKAPVCAPYELTVCGY